VVGPLPYRSVNSKEKSLREQLFFLVVFHIAATVSIRGMGQRRSY